jgi:hypothetical protein
MFQGLGVEVKTRTLKTAGMRHPAKSLWHPATPGVKERPPAGIVTSRPMWYMSVHNGTDTNLRPG